MAPYAMDTDGRVPFLFENIRENIRDDRPQEIEIGRPSHTEQLTKWITDVRHKKLKCNRSPKRNFRMEAVLTHALHQAEYELRVKQLSRLSRWLRLRKQLLKGVNYGACGVYNMAEEELERTEPRGDPRHNIFWPKEDLCEDLTSLDNFLTQLNEVKPVAQR